MPDGTVFDHYVTNGTTITVPGNLIDSVLLSPANNPYGATTNPEGIYVIDCNWQDVTIQNSRVVGTLVMLNAGNNSSIEQSVNWEPAVANYPVLLVSGQMTFDFMNTPLSEVTTGINFNPPGTGYEGAENTNKIDTFPSVIRGLVYVSGFTRTDNSVTIDGVVVVGDQLLTAYGSAMNLSYDPSYMQNPPPGFAGPVQMIVSPGSWQRTIN